MNLTIWKPGPDKIMVCEPIRYNGITRVQIHIVKTAKPVDAYKPNVVKANKIAKNVFTYLGVGEVFISLKTRKTEVIEAKRISIYIISNYAKITEEDQSEIFNIDRSTINYHIKTCDGLMWSDRAFKEKVERIIKDLKITTRIN